MTGVELKPSDEVEVPISVLCDVALLYGPVVDGEETPVPRDWPTARTAKGARMAERRTNVRDPIIFLQVPRKDLNQIRTMKEKLRKEMCPTRLVVAV